MAEIACPDCGCQRFYVKDPDDPYELYFFDCVSGRIVFEDDDRLPDNETEAYCDRCAWHGKIGVLTSNR